MQSTRSHRPLHVLLLILLSAGLLAVSCEGDKKDDPSDPKATAAGTSDEGGGSDVDVNIYPGFPMNKLPADKRGPLIEMAKAELCPCEDSTESLHKCMTRPADERCPLATQITGTMAGGLASELSKTDIMDKVAEFVANAKKIHSFELKGVPAKGNTENASIVIVEFADFECPHCKLASGVLGELIKENPDTVLYFKNYPLPFHTHARPAAEAALAAKMQGKFWPMHDLLFKHQSSLSLERIKALGAQLGLNLDRFAQDRKSPMVKGAIERDKKEGEDAGVSGTPAIFINGRQYLGGIDKASIEGAVESARAELEAKKKAEENKEGEKAEDAEKAKAPAEEASAEKN